MTTTTTEPIPTIGSPEFVADANRWYARLRREDPVHRGEIVMMPGAPAYFLARHEDCVAVATDPRFRRTVDGASPLPIPKALRLMSTETLILKDDPEHRRLRTLVSAAFTPKATARLAGRVEEITTGLLDAMSPGQEVDVQAEYAYRIPLTVICEMVGIPLGERERFRESINLLISGVATIGLEAAAQEVGELAEHVRDIIRRRRETPGDDVITDLLAAADGDQRLTEDEIIATVFLLVIAGFETTQHVITNGVVALITHPDQLAALLADPDQVGPTMVEEVLRWTGTIGGTKPSFPTEDVTVRGVRIPAGSMVFPLLASANRDEDVFVRADDLDVTRSPNDHVAFSKGNHFCLGASLARMEVRTALVRFFERFPGTRLAVPQDELVRVSVPLWNRIDGLPVVLG